MFLLKAYVLRIDNKTLQQLLDHIQTECQPGQAIPQLEAILSKRLPPYPRQNITLTCAVAWLHCGNWEHARQLLESIPAKSETIQQARLEFLRQSALFNCCFYNQNPAGAQYHLAQMQKLLASLNAYNTVQKDIANQFRYAMLHAQYLLQILQGNLDGASTFLHNRIGLAFLPIEKVALYHQLGCVLARQNQMQQARQAFAYVVQNGGTTWYAQAAAAWLQQAPAY